jgi:hypothetical protein
MYFLIQELEVSDIKSGSGKEMFPLEQIIRFTGFEAACIKPDIAHILDCGHDAGRVGLAGAVITTTEETQLCQT